MYNYCFKWVYLFVWYRFKVETNELFSKKNMKLLYKMSSEQLIKSELTFLVKFLES